MSRSLCWRVTGFGAGAPLRSVVAPGHGLSVTCGEAQGWGLRMKREEAGGEGGQQERERFEDSGPDVPSLQKGCSSTTPMSKQDRGRSRREWGAGVWVCEREGRKLRGGIEWKE